MSHLTGMNQAKSSKDTVKEYNLRPRNQKGEIYPKTLRKMEAKSPSRLLSKDIKSNAEPTPSVKPKHADKKTAGNGNATSFSRSDTTHCAPGMPGIATQGAMQSSSQRTETDHANNMATIISTISEAVKTAVAESYTEINLKLDRVISDMSSFKSELATTKQVVADLEVAVRNTSERMSTVETTVIPSVTAECRKLVDDLKDKMILQEIHNRITFLELFDEL